MEKHTSIQAQVSAEEWALRVDLAACYRLVALHGWDDLIFTHISARVPNEPNHFLINPYGLLFNEVTASSLVKVDLNGNKVLESEFSINPAGFMIHSAVHEARLDTHCVIHLHTNAGVAVSAQEAGLLPISQQSLLPYSDLAYHGYEGIVLTADEKQRLISDLEDKHFMILRNHGLLTCAETIQDAFLYMYILQTACEIQVMATSGQQKVLPVIQPIVDGIQQQAKAALNQAGGKLAWPGLLRKLNHLDDSYQN